MTAPNSTVDQNLLPVQAYFDVYGNFQTFIGQGKPFYATVNPSQSGLNITNSTINSTTIGATTPSTGVFTNIATTTGTISTQPTGSTDIVNLLALQSYAAGISWKQPCAVATLANITLSGLQTIDGYLTLVGDRVLVKNQTNAANNGIYIASATAWTCSLDADAWQEYVSAITFIEYGTQSNGAWFCTAQPGGTLGVTALNWSQFIISASYTAGTGLTLTGQQFSITNVGTAGTYGSATLIPVITTNAQGQITGVTTASNPQGTVTSVTGTLPISSSGGATPAISISQASTSTNGYLSSTDWNTFNNKQASGTYVNSVSGTAGRITSTGGTTPVIDLASGIATAGTTGSASLIPVITIDTYGRVTSITTAANPQGTVTSVTGTSPVVSSGGATPAISMPAATGSVNGYLTSTDWTTFNGKANAFTYTNNYIPYGQGTTTPLQSSALQFNGTTLTLANDASISGLTVGKGGGAVSTATVVGSGALAASNTGTLTTAVGYSALRANTTGDRNHAFGANALYTNTTGSYNTAIGQGTLYTNNADNNTALGWTSLLSNTSGSNNTAVGYQAGYNNTTSSQNAFFGGSSGFTNTGGYNTFLGQNSGYNNSTGARNTYVGQAAGYYYSTGADNVSLGWQALVGGSTPANNTGGYNTAIGNQALQANTTANNNTAVGYQSLYSNSTTSWNTAIGTQALYTNTNNFNTAIGYQAGYLNTSGGVTALGTQALYSNTSGSANTAIGGFDNATSTYGALFSNTTGSYNIAVGTGALKSNTTASNNTAVGYQASYSQAGAGADGQTAIGYQALYSNVTGGNNTALGYKAAYATTGQYNTAIGLASLINNSTGSSNTALGNDSLRNNTTASYNTAVGYQAGYSNTTGTQNTYLGSFAGYSTTGSYNVLVGMNAGYYLTSGVGNTFIGNANGGNGAGQSVTTGSKNTIIGGFTGNNGGLDIRTASNYIVLSDGDGNPRGIFDGSGNFLVGKTALNAAVVGLQVSTTGQVNSTLAGSTSATLSYALYSAGASAYRFYVGMDGTINATSIVITAISDERLKENIRDLDTGLSTVMALKPRRFDWKEGKGQDKKNAAGFIAQEFETVFPESVGVSKAGGDGIEYKNINHETLIPTLVKAIQELKAEVDSLKQQLNGA